MMMHSWDYISTVSDTPSKAAVPSPCQNGLESSFVHLDSGKLMAVWRTGARSFTCPEPICGSTSSDEARCYYLLFVCKV
jgi:hypothetical protein